MPRARSSPLPALAGSVLLHGGLLALILVAWPWLNPPPRLSQVVPVTIVTSNDQGSAMNAVAAPSPAPAQTETPVPDAASQAAAPQQTPAPIKAPTPAQPKAAPVKAAPPPPATPKPAAAKPTPAPPPKPAPAKPDKTLDLDALAASLAPQSHASGAQRSSAQRGPNRLQTAPTTQTTNGAGIVSSTGASASMVHELERLWIPDCQVAAAAQLNIVVTFTLDRGGRLVGQVRSSGDNATNTVVQVASERAVRAVLSAVPFADLPASDYGRQQSVNFDAKKACAQK